MELTCDALARMLDLSVVRADCTDAKVRALADAAKRYHCIIATTLPSHTPLLVDLLADAPDTGVGGNVGFPSGGETRATKVAQAKELVGMGCAELDMVVDVGMLLSGRYDYVGDEIRAVVDAGAGLPVKVIVECHYLTDDAIRKACELCVSGGASFVKTGTGWAPTGATLENVALIKSCVGDAVSIKASGGIRGIETVVEMYRRGARRFGIGLGSEAGIFAQCAARGPAVER